MAGPILWLNNFLKGEEVMKGADEFCEIFINAEQVGNLYMVPSSHARGNTFYLYVLPDGEKAIENGGCNPPLNKDSVEVYGVISGQRGWTEAYGWLHDGQWQDDFYELFKKRKAAAEKLRAATAESNARTAGEKRNKTAELLASYKS
jgi:hypothetical protein